MDEQTKERLAKQLEKLQATNDIMHSALCQICVGKPEDARVKAAEALSTYHSMVGPL